MKSGKKIIVVIIIMLILLMMVGVAFAYVYLATDILKTDKELFFTYFSQVTEQDGFIDPQIQAYREKQMQIPYENSGNITVQAEYPEKSLEKVMEKVNELSIDFFGKIDPINKKVEQNIEIDYGNDVVLPINYKQSGNKFGVKIEKLLKKYIAIRNEDLEEFAAKFGVEEAILEDIEEIQTTEKITFTTEEIESLKQTYGTVFQQNLLDENFSKVKTQLNESYTLELSGEQLNNISVGLLEATVQNPLIVNKINKFLMDLDSNADTFDITEIESLVESMKEQDVSNIPSLKLTLVQSNKQLNQIIVQSAENQISIEKNKSTESLNYNINCQMKETANSNSLVEQTADQAQVNTYLNIQYIGLENLNNVQQNYECGFEMNVEEDVIKYDYKIKGNTEFKDSILIEELDEDVAVFLNDYESADLIAFFPQLGTRLLTLNKNQMGELGLQEYENPLLYSNPLTLLIALNFKIKDMANDTIENNDLSQQEILLFNQKFSKYVGEERSGADVNALIKTVQNSNLYSETQNGRFVKITLDGIEISENVDSSKTYSVEAGYGENGVITEMKVITKN